MTETLTLQRQPSTPDGTFGQLFRNGQQICVTGELPWLNNEPDKSCIPLGLYLCIPHDSIAHPQTWEFTNVPGRSEVLLHNGNSPLKDSLGCVLVGNTYGVVDGMKAVMNSVLTLDKLREELPDTFYINIKQ